MFLVLTTTVAFADPCKVGDRIIVRPGHLVFNDRHKQEELAWTGKTTASDIQAAIEEGDAVMVKRPVGATVIDEVGQEMQIQQEGGMTWWTTKMAIKLAR